MYVFITSVRQILFVSDLLLAGITDLMHCTVHECYRNSILIQLRADGAWGV